jgi:multicomponent Na+:H+ antiporter subunit F
MLTFWNILLIVLAVAFVLAFVRLARGPSLADRVLALDVIVAVAVSIITIYAIAYDRPGFLDVAIILALIGFVATVAFAQYLEKLETS